MDIIIPNLVFVVLIAILTGYLTFLTTKGGLTDNRNNNPWKRMTKRGKRVIFVLFLMLLLLVSQEYNNQNLRKKNQTEMTDERVQRDSLIADGIKRGIVKVIRDSIRSNVVNNYSLGDPVLIIENIFLKNKNTKSGEYGLTFKSADEGSTNFNILSYLLTGKNGEYDLSKLNFFPRGLKLPKNAAWTMYFGSASSPIADTIYIYLKGSYTKLDGSKLYKIDDLYFYNLLENKVSILPNSKRDSIIRIIKKVPENKLVLKE
jgi:hypothetical protein